MFRMIRVNMNDLSARFEDIPKEYQGLGGRCLTSAIVSKEVEPTANAIGPRNKLVIAPGLLGGTSCANSGRVSVGAKSPLTGTIKESNSGGQPGAYLAKLGIAAIVVEGMAAEGKLFKLVLKKEEVELVSADDLKGLGNYATVKKLAKKYGDKAGYITIGPAGEWRMSAASVAFSDMEVRPTRHAGRGGMGAVMGSKGIKAIVVDPAGAEKVPIEDKEAFKAAAKRFAKAIQAHPVTREGLTNYGTTVLMNTINEAGGLPTRTSVRAGSWEPKRYQAKASTS